MKHENIIESLYAPLSAFKSEGREVSTVAAEIKLKIFGIQEEIIRLLNIAIDLSSLSAVLIIGCRH